MNTKTKAQEVKANVSAANNSKTAITPKPAKAPRAAANKTAGKAKTTKTAKAATASSGKAEKIAPISEVKQDKKTITVVDAKIKKDTPVTAPKAEIETPSAVAIEKETVIPEKLGKIVGSVSKEAISEKLDKIKDASKVTTDKVKETAEAVKKTVKETSEDIVKTVKKTAAKAKEIDKLLFIEYYGKQVSETEIVERFKQEWTKEHKLSEIESLKIYYKIEENTAYYLVNDEITLSLVLR